jgi:putative glutamine amidotransferase
MLPLIGITTDLTERGEGKPARVDCSAAYSRAIAAAGGAPILLPPIPEMVPHHARLCDGFVFTGGDDPRTEAFGVPTHPEARPIHPDRQAYELALLDLLRDDRAQAPVLGVCLGMQMMALHAGGRLNQHLPETLATAAEHKGEHLVTPNGERSALKLADGRVWSNHHQAVQDPGRLRVTAVSPDGVIEAIASGQRAFYCGVQWHPERTADPNLGLGVFGNLVGACRSTRLRPA